MLALTHARQRSQAVYCFAAPVLTGNFFDPASNRHHNQQLLPMHNSAETHLDPFLTAAAYLRHTQQGQQMLRAAAQPDSVVEHCMSLPVLKDTAHLELYTQG